MRYVIMQKMVALLFNGFVECVSLLIIRYREMAKQETIRGILVELGLLFCFVMISSALLLVLVGYYAVMTPVAFLTGRKNNPFRRVYEQESWARPESDGIARAVNQYECVNELN